MQVEVPFKPTIEEEELNVDMNDEKFLFFDQNINLNFELSEEKLENIKKIKICSLTFMNKNLY